MQNQSFKRLKEVAVEMNESCLFNPPLEYIKTTEQQLKEDLLRAAEYIEPGDKFKPSTIDFLWEMGAKIGKRAGSYIFKIGKKEPVDKKKKKKKEKKEKDFFNCFGIDYDRQSNICEDCMRHEFCKRAYRKKLAILKGIKNDDTLYKKTGLLFFEYDRKWALIDALKIGGSKEEVVSMANELFMRKGGDDDLKKMRRVFNGGVSWFSRVKMMRIHGDFFTFNKRRI